MSNSTYCRSSRSVVSFLIGILIIIAVALTTGCAQVVTTEWDNLDGTVTRVNSAGVTHGTAPSQSVVQVQRCLRDPETKQLSHCDYTEPYVTDGSSLLEQAAMPTAFAVGSSLLPEDEVNVSNSQESNVAGATVGPITATGVGTATSSSHSSSVSGVVSGGGTKPHHHPKHSKH